MMVQPGLQAPAARKWYHWYSPEDTHEERKLILKLDLLIVPYAFVLYWVKYIDQSNISKSKAARKIGGPTETDNLSFSRQCLRFWNVRGPWLSWKSACPISDHLCCWQCPRPVALHLLVLPSPDAFTGSNAGSWLGGIYALTVPG